MEMIDIIAELNRIIKNIDRAVIVSKEVNEILNKVEV